jgi:hypothetical protein
LADFSQPSIPLKRSVLVATSASAVEAGSRGSGASGGGAAAATAANTSAQTATPAKRRFQSDNELIVWNGTAEGRSGEVQIAFMMTRIDVGDYDAWKRMFDQDAPRVTAVRAFVWSRRLERQAAPETIRQIRSLRNFGCARRYARRPGG